MERIIGIHPVNEELRFLRKLIREFKKKYPENFLYLKLSPNYVSHDSALKVLKDSSKSEPILFFGHGRSDRLLGCSFRAWHGGHPKRYVHDERHHFITTENIEIFSGKKIFCLACNSSALGHRAIERGAKVFLGFKEINFDDKNLLESGRGNKFVIAFTKWKLRQAVFYSLMYGIDRDKSFLQMRGHLELLLTRISDNVILTMKNNRKANLYKRVAKNLQIIRAGIFLQGDPNTRVI